MLWIRPLSKCPFVSGHRYTRSRNHPDASLSEKGFVKLSNANQSSSETEAATPKAVKIVNDRLNAVVDRLKQQLKEAEAALTAHIAIAINKWTKLLLMDGNMQMA